MSDELQRLTRLANIAELYYREGLTQSRIAERLGVSTMQISRLLKEAETAGVVEVRINHPLPVDEEAGRELRSQFGLGSVTAVKVRDSTNPKHEVARAAALRLSSLVEPHRTLAVAWSSTLALMAFELPRTTVEGLNVVQMIGALTLADDARNPYDVVSEFGARFGAQVQKLHAPTLLRSREAREALINDPSVRTVLNQARAADLAVCGIGAAGLDSTFLKLGYLSHREFEDLRARGVVGDILGNLIDAHGNALEWSHSDMLVSVSLEELRRIPQVLAVAAGPTKARAILAALRGGYCSHLVTDADTARDVLRLLAADEARAGSGEPAQVRQVRA
ncbi:MAG: sugar-binding transcriptional regulator [Trueperaceae bacterium]|nr:sugar-binding transcriptional regulator [Trueperaceae bacterium]